ncbi:hypothetical protein CLAFUW4_05409 [Fulvia fulva]|uniref:Uncharacterized protein n=1 Tax=Passalora fulva TaxID=5499 RepID=A0A9Q8LHV6_PASFU|nr:uncharacterized protein CLAFUR5_05556 [Fulvia fulva]KAK4624224.1 hypothetical protein CLAFUR4_05403 [Fulvia fulva]UJO17931.1 hypothetical protein CLAFUR5_05556 [Fulvia fulva]WPV14646.1 hypothetical protein CLAFUW4_05409 [Fulvia fulva]WPV29891.1 hypothetical protein CLAFUW7_05407 [Fulvia fulva]
MSSADARVAEATRIAEQHEYITSGLGFLIHPVIEHHIKDCEGPIRIADVSEGLQFPSDNDFRWPKCPIEVTRISIRDVIKPDGLHESAGTFHVVAVRLAHLSIGNTHWNTAIHNLTSLLRPGGWIQWTDWDPRTARIAGVKPGAEDKALRDLLQRYSDFLKEKQVGTTYRISSSLTDTGLGQEDSDMYPLPPDVGLTRNIAHGALRQLETAESVGSEEVERLRKEVDDEIEAGGSLIWYDLWCHIARKPKR